MERCHSVLSLPQDSRNTAKYNLVKIARSDGETNTVFDEDIFCMGDHDFKSRKRKTRLSKSIQELNLTGERFVPPSSGRIAKRKVTRVPSQDDLWKSIQTNYSFLMADDLIAECQETRKELYLPPPSSVTISNPDSASPHHMLSYEEFLENFNHAHDNLHILQTSVSNMDLGEMEIEKLFSHCQYLKDQASLLKLMNPDLRDEINRRCNILSNKLEILEKIVYPKRTQEKSDTIKSLADQMKSIRQWLQEVEVRLRKLKLSDDCATEEMSDVFSQEKILQREIEGRGKELTSLIRQCDSLEGATVAESKRLRRAAAHLERSWHNIWIRSLEKQCLTEQRLLRRHSEESNQREASDIELDEGPLNKHRRLTLDRWTAVASTANMDRSKRSTDIIKSGLLTKEIGVLCNDLVPVNDKCIMVGTTGIAALKAEYGDDFTNFEIIQDVGYSSESSTHLSSDDGISVGGDRYFNIRVYNYTDKKAPSKNISLKEELHSGDSKQPSSLASSVGSSSGAPSFNDSGLGASDLLATGDSSEAQYEKILVQNDCDNFDPCLHDDESDFLETVLESCVDFCPSDDGKEESNGFNGVDDLQYNLSGIESDDSADDFHKKRSFTASSQLFYKMILVDTENEEEVDGNDHTNVPYKFPLTLDSSNTTIIANGDVPEFSNELNETIVHLKDKSPPNNKSPSTDSEQETYKVPPPISPVAVQPRTSFQKYKCLNSTPVKSQDRRDTRSFASPNLKRKRDSDSNDLISTWEGGGGIRVRSWLKRCSRTLDTAPKTNVRRRLFKSGSEYSSSEESSQNPILRRLSEDISSCDASGEYTSSSADEGNAMSSTSSFFDDDMFNFKERLDSCSAEGSVETVIRGLKTPRRSESGSGELLPPPLSSTPSSLRRRQRNSESLRCCDGPFSNHSCADLRWFVMKASSEGDLRTRTWQMSEHSSTNIPTNQQQKENFAFDFKHRLSSSLPNVLRHRSDSSTDDTKGSILSHSDSKTDRRCSQHEDSFTSFVSHNQSSSSEFEKKKKRRSRRKSSSSNRSSRTVLTGSDKSRIRSKTLTSGCSSNRRRNMSQRSDLFDGSENNFYSESDGTTAVMHKASREELNPKNLKDELELALKDNIKGCRNSASLLSPAESDVVLTHLEEQSTVSDQVWDGYQDMPYLSEAYSEATVDEDAVRKLTEFGDDYGSAIGQPMRFLDTVDDTKIDVSKSPSKKSSKSNSHNNDSDSDLEDLHHLIEEAGKALQFARVTIERRQSGDFFSSAENAELLATCGTHLHCLQTICEHIALDGNENNFSDADLKELHYLIEEWKILKRSIDMYEEVDEDKIKQKYLKAQKNIDDLFNKMSELSSLAEIESEDFKTWDELQDSISRLQMVLSKLQDTREQLLSVNLQVHRFVTEYGGDEKYKDNCLKEDITELYQKWEDIYEMNGTQLTELETLNTKWIKYTDKFKDLNLKVFDLLSSSEDCDINCHKLEDEVAYSLQKDLKELKADAVSLRKYLKNTETWKSIQRDLYDLEKRINAHSSSSSVSRSADHPNSSLVEDDPDDHFEDAIQQLDAYDSIQRQKLSIHHLEDGSPRAKKKSKFWRIIRVAIPVQLTLVLLFCLACYLEPNCCDRLNNLNFSFTPHLRYFRGPPPV